ncbi:hypothetical protein DFH06DRAFT_1313045 [Mycena polygramma]|nr:hypothetical protein DFH06DRAFT_1313045 [Mycena polygramma]
MSKPSSSQRLTRSSSRKASSPFDGASASAAGPSGSAAPRHPTGQPPGSSVASPSGSAVPRGPLTKPSATPTTGTSNRRPPVWPPGSSSAGPLGSAVPRGSLARPPTTSGPPSLASTLPLASAAGPSGSAAPASTSDDRVYSTARVKCNNCYDFRPGVILGARVELPTIFRYHGREVKFGSEWYEAWSPNSLQRPYLPGRKKPSSELFPAKLSQRRFDGFPGRFDPMEAPQYDSSGSEWLPFARRPSTVRASESCVVGFTSIAVEWSKGRPDGNRVNVSFLNDLQAWHNELCDQSEGLRDLMQKTEWENRTPMPSQQDFDYLADCRKFENAVDACARIQWLLRERQAWVAMCCAFLNIAEVTDMWVKPYGAADDNLVGVWVNGASERVVAWYLQAKVPVFLLHRYGATEMRRSEREELPILSDFAEGTEAFDRKSATKNGCAYLARKGEFAYTWVEDDDGRDVDLPAIDEHHSYLSSSLFLEARQRARADEVELPTSPSKKPEDPRYAAPPLFRYILHQGRVAWIEPPSIEPVTEGQWEKWELSSEVDVNDGEEVVFKRAKKWRQTEDEGSVWYDRQLRREIYVYADYQPPLGVVHSWTFGIPAPRVPYFEGKRQKAASHWMYRSREPLPRDIGRSCEFPVEEDLPFTQDSSLAPLSKLDGLPAALPQVKLELPPLTLAPSPPSRAAEDFAPSQTLPAALPSPGALEVLATSLLPTVEEEPMALEELRSSPLPTDNGKGKWREMSEDAVSLGSELEEELEERSAADEFLATAIEPNPPSRFIRIRHLSDSPSSFTFVERFARLLRLRDCAMESVLNAQHAIWVCFAGAMEGERAMACFADQLGGNGTELAFETEAEFTNAQLYGTDAWHPALTDNTDSAAAVPMTVDEPPPRAPPTAPRAMLRDQRPYELWTPYESIMPRVPPPTARRLSPPRAGPSGSKRRRSPSSDESSDERDSPSPSPPARSDSRPPRSPSRAPRSSRSPSPGDDDDAPEPPRGGAPISSHGGNLYSRLYHPPRPLTPFEERVARSAQQPESSQWTNPDVAAATRMIKPSGPTGDLLSRLTAPPPLSLGQRLTDPPLLESGGMTSASSQTGSLLRRADVQLEERLRDRQRRIRRKKRGRRAGKHNRLRRDTDSSSSDSE